MRQDLRRFDVPTLVIHGNEDQIVPIDVGGRASAALIPGAELKEYAGAPHHYGHHKEQLNGFAKAGARRAGGSAA